MPWVTETGEISFIYVDEEGRMRFNGLLEDGELVSTYEGEDIGEPWTTYPDPAEPTPPRVYKDSTQHEKVRHSLERSSAEAIAKGVGGDADQDHWHKQVHRLVSKLGVYSPQVFSYITYADGLKYKVCKYVWWMDRVLEHTILRQRFEARGLNPLVLDEIDKMQPWNTGMLP